MGTRHGFQQQRALAKIEPRFALDATHRQHHHGGAVLPLQFGGKIFGEEFTARFEVVREVLLADELSLGCDECAIAKHVVEVHVGIDDIAHGLSVSLPIAARSARPVASEPPVSITATQRAPMTTPRLALSPRAASSMSAVWPRCI